VKYDSNDYVTRVLDAPGQADAAAWDQLLAEQPHATPFMRSAYLRAMHESKSATPRTGWTPKFVTLWRGDELHAACAMYLKDHSYGEYVFDWAWANAYEQHGLDYYPKALIAPPFSPVPGARLLARDEASRRALLRAVLAECRKQELSSLHVLFMADEDIAAAQAEELMFRHTVQFHWKNEAPSGGTGWSTFDDFLASLSQEKRKKIRQERRKVHEAGVTFRVSEGAAIATEEWDFFYRCYERTYREHGNPPYLTREFFRRMQSDMPENWVLFTAVREGRPIATSLIAASAIPMRPGARFDSKSGEKTAFGRYWGAIERVDCLHFEACYYQPIEWCIANGFATFEGGAQGEHKMARALMPVQATSAHWLAHPAFADAVERFLEREGEGVERYLEHLEARSPFRKE
jgi:uncharacterized protein